MQEAEFAVIRIADGEIVLVDDADERMTRSFDWRLNADGYPQRGARVNGKYGKIFLHREVMRALTDERVDHVNRLKFDCRRLNLRKCLFTGNAQNGGNRKVNTSGYKGVHLSKASGRYIAQISVSWKKIRIGEFDNAVDAAIAYDTAAERYHGQFAATNKMLGNLQGVSV